MSTPVGGDTDTCDRHAHIARTYADALERGDADALVRLLAAHPCFVSPFSVWTGTRAVAAAYTARTRAFDSLALVAVLSAGSADDDTGGQVAIRWAARVRTRVVEGVDILQLDDDRISAIDVFLRPADVLDDVYAAMTDAWPQRR